MSKSHRKLSCCVYLLLVIIAPGIVNAKPRAGEGPSWDLRSLSSAPKIYPAPGFEEPGVKAIFYDGLPFQGKPTRVFAWYGAPQTKTGEKVPAMVLVHGGLGTAFADWVRLWNSRGYAAIAMDTCGSTAGGDNNKRPRHADGGPPGWGGFEQVDWSVIDQWTYHAVADVILANSLLRSFPEIDSDRIGVTGISWGGFLTCIVAGLDPRFKFAAPVYGTGFINENPGMTPLFAGIGPDKTADWLRLWDPSNYLKKVKMPMLWVTGTNDGFTLGALQKSYRLTLGPHFLSVRVRMPHGQGQGQAPEEIHAFADYLLKKRIPLARVLKQGRAGENVWAKFKTRTPIVKALLNYTKDVGPWTERKWESITAHVDSADGKTTATLPSGALVYYFNLFDERSLITSSEHVQVNGK